MGEERARSIEANNRHSAASTNVISINSFSTVDDTRRFCGLCRSMSDFAERAV